MEIRKNEQGQVLYGGSFAPDCACGITPPEDFQRQLKKLNDFIEVAE